MALQKKDYLTAYGAKAEHWVVQSVNTNAHHGWADITFAGYINEELYEQGVEPIDQHRSKLNIDTGFATYLDKKKAISTFKNMNIYELAYTVAKEEDDFFRDAIDI